MAGLLWLAALLLSAAGARAADEFGAQLEKSLLDESSKRPLLACPNCLYKTDKARSHSDSVRLEAIKHQILLKLGLKDRPNVTHSLPRQVVMETLYRAEESRGFLGDGDAPDTDAPTTSARSAATDTADYDDFYGRTSEIITFAEQGQLLNDNRLLEFRMSRESDETTGQEMRVRAATLWLRVELRPRGRARPGPQHHHNHHQHHQHHHHHHHHHHHQSQHQDGCVPTLWVFTVKPDLEDSITRLGAQDFNEMTELSASQPMEVSELGWQKFDVTGTVRDWYAEARGRRLRLLVDCSGCCRHVQVHTFGAAAAAAAATAAATPATPAPVPASAPGGDAPRPGAQPQTDLNRPFLVVHTDPSATKRVRRRALDCTGAVKNQCCKQRFYVSFKDLGWEDWVIAPGGYYANYCRGDCGAGHRTPDTFLNYYTHVIEEIRKTHQLSGMQPCCAPLKFSSMSLIYYGPDYNIIKRDLPKMVVDECGCP